VTDAIADVGRVRALLVSAAAAGEDRSYSHILALLGHRFTRPRMRALCRTLDAIDEAARASGEPALAVLVVREGDRLPGQGWWIGRADIGHLPDWTGAGARAFVAERQAEAFAYWASQSPPAMGVSPESPARHT
jgi:hypothetical protein